MKGIYQYKDLKTGNIVYVGKDSHIDKNVRYYAHLYPSNYDKQPFNRIIQNNPDRYEYSILCSGEYSDLQLNKLERLFIKIFNPKFNFTTGGDGCDYWDGKTFSEEHKRKISESLTGITRSEEHKKNISKSLTGRTLSEEHKRKISKSLTGRTLSEEHKRKISKSMNTTGYLNVYKTKDKTCKQGFYWTYSYYVNGKRKYISSVDIKKLEKKVKAKGLEWREL